MTASPRDAGAPRRVDLLAPPMAGHLHPVLGMAVRLAREPGLQVRVLTTEAAQPAVAASGLAGVVLVPGADAQLREVVDPPYRVGSDLRLMRRQLRSNVDLQRRLREDLLERWASGSPERPDLVIADFTMIGAATAATTLGLRWWTSHPSPCAIEGRSGPPSYVGGWRPGVGVAGRVRDAAGRGLVRAVKRSVPVWSGVRTADAGVERVYRADGSESIYSPELVLGLTPPAIEYERDLPPAVRLIGPVLFTPPNHAPPLDLAPGRRHVLLTAGTHLAWHKPALVEAAQRIAAELADLGDVCLHVSLGGSTGVPEQQVDDGRVVVHRSVSYARDLARFSAVVHHGGSGVLGHTLAAGLPAVVWPVDYDQADHAVRLEDAGVAVRVGNADEVGAALRRVLTRPCYREAAARIAAEIASHPAEETVATWARKALLPG